MIIFDIKKEIHREKRKLGFSFKITLESKVLGEVLKLHPRKMKLNVNLVLVLLIFLDEENEASLFKQTSTRINEDGLLSNNIKSSTTKNSPTECILYCKNNMAEVVINDGMCYCMNNIKDTMLLYNEKERVPVEVYREGKSKNCLLPLKRTLTLSVRWRIIVSHEVGNYEVR